LSLLIVCDEGGISADEYEDILYDGLFSLVDNLLEIPEGDDVSASCRRKHFSVHARQCTMS